MAILCALAGPALLVSCNAGPARAIDAGPSFKGRAGCFLLLDLGSGESLTWGTLCDERSSPCSTFKIPNALIGLDSGVLEDERHVFRYDGQPRRRTEWNKDMQLGEALRTSCVPCFQELARAIGPERMRSYLDRFDYGNRDTSGGIDQFWLGNSLAISPREQLDFLARLYRDQLPVKPAAAATVRRLLVQEEAPGWSWSGKTGSCQFEGRPPHGWFVGHVHRGDRQAVFATFMRGEGAWGIEARAATAELLRQHGWWGLAQAPSP
ncbi:MAG: class D beta-lactamase [Acidobacteria bacterium]|nr:class D beta-lactamase [Acidobacteriota bacterium]